MKLLAISAHIRLSIPVELTAHAPDTSPAFGLALQSPELLAQKAAEEDRQIEADKAKIAQKLSQPKARPAGPTVLAPDRAQRLSAVSSDNGRLPPPSAGHP